LGKSVNIDLFLAKSSFGRRSWFMRICHKPMFLKNNWQGNCPIHFNYIRHHNQNIMISSKKTFTLLLFTWITFQASAQVTAVRRYNPSGDNAAATESAEDKASRRAAALSKVQGSSTKSMSSKGARPATYSTDEQPVEYSSAPNPSTTMTVNGLEVARNVRKGKGQVGNELFTPVGELFYVQFAVYCKDTPVDKAPPIEGLLLLWHGDSKCPGGEAGASYIVKGYNSADEAKAAVNQFKAKKIDCWFNPALTGAEVEVIGVR
jgi:hypothetical protein